MALSPKDLYEMGWNDVTATLAKAYACGQEEKIEYANDLKNDRIDLPRKSAKYRQGTHDAADAFLRNDPVTYKGSPDQIAYMEEIVAATLASAPTN